MIDKNDMPVEIWVRPLSGGSGKLLSAVRPESPLIDQYKNIDAMRYTKYIKEKLR